MDDRISADDSSRLTASTVGTSHSGSAFSPDDQPILSLYSNRLGTGPSRRGDSSYDEAGGFVFSNHDGSYGDSGYGSSRNASSHASSHDDNNSIWDSGYGDSSHGDSSHGDSGYGDSGYGSNMFSVGEPLHQTFQGIYPYSFEPFQSPHIPLHSTARDAFQNPHTVRGGRSRGVPSGPLAAQSHSSDMSSPQRLVSVEDVSTANTVAPINSSSQTKPPNAPSYYKASPSSWQPSFPYAAQRPPSQHSTARQHPVSRDLGLLSGRPEKPDMVLHTYPPDHLHPYQSGSQMPPFTSVVLPLPLPPQSRLYGYGQPASRSEKPFKCDQCIQSFSRNHDLKRHKRTHLAIKPFPCAVCGKKFSRKDALKRHRDVKGCETKIPETPDESTPENDKDDTTLLGIVPGTEGNIVISEVESKLEHDSETNENSIIPSRQATSRPFSEINDASQYQDSILVDRGKDAPTPAGIVHESDMATMEFDRADASMNSATNLIPLIEQTYKEEREIGDDTPPLKSKSTGKGVEDGPTKSSKESILSLSNLESDIERFADHLVERISNFNLDKQALKAVSTVLPDSLKTFALRLDYYASTRDFANFVHKNRMAIAGAFIDKTFKLSNSTVDTQRSCSTEVALNEVVESWFKGQNLEKVERHDDLETKRHTTDPSLPNKLAFSSQPEDELEYHKSNNPSCNSDEKTQNNKSTLCHRPHGFPLKLEAFDWLIANLRAESLLAPMEPRTRDEIWQKINPPVQTFPDIHGRSFFSESKVTFVVDWAVFAFFDQQGYMMEPSEAVSRVVTLTGSFQDAQAVTCAQYLSQTWPMTGATTMKLIQDILRNEADRQHICNLSDGTKLHARLVGSKFLLEASGSTASILEIGEQLAWLGAALRASPQKHGLAFCTPFVETVSTQYFPDRLECPLEMEVKIGFTTELIHPPSDGSTGQCWHGMFMNPVIAKGYPILRREKLESGIEMPLNIMAGLARADKVDSFGSKTFIKGFSTLLILTERCKNLLFWHLVYSADGSRISYLDNTPAHEGGLGGVDIGECRHIVGWCSEAQFFAGSSGANHFVGNSGLPKPGKSGALANTYVSPGRCIVGGATYLLGCKDTPVHVSRNGYIQKLEWISSKFFLLWDETDKRGWLVNGTSALLYITRACLEHKSRNKFKAALLFKKEQLKESPTPFSADSAIDVLIDQENLQIKLYKDYDGSLVLQSQIEYFYSILEKLLDHQADISGQDGVNLINKPRGELEGWDFKDLATNRDPLYPRVASLDARGKSWVDFTRAMHVVTLFGSGFGEVIKPANADICAYWAQLPKDKYYIAACLSDVMQMTRNNDYGNDGHTRLSSNCIWHTPTTVFGSCQCKGILNPNHSEPVQALLPSSMLDRLLTRTEAVPEESSGAIIFGQNSALAWFWGDHGVPQAGRIPVSSKWSDFGSFNDSGVGSSILSDSDGGNMVSRSNTPKIGQSSSARDSESFLGEPGIAAAQQPFTQEDYTVGIICALPKELLAVRALFDKKHESLDQIVGDSNHYALGQMQKHMVVAACLPAGNYGTNPAADSASNMKRTFPNIVFCLIVGVGGGAPSDDNDIRLGDVVVSLPTSNYPGVIQFDRGKENENNGFQITGSLPPPPKLLMTAISALRSNPDLPCHPLKEHLTEIVQRVTPPNELKYLHPGQEHDDLFVTACPECQNHSQQNARCESRDDHLQKRSPRLTDDPEIHYGLIASGNRVMKDAQIRDRWAREYGVMCFEMEAAGIMDIFPSLVIRGICDYADSYKNKIWQEYAAATAAAYAKLLLGVVVPPKNCQELQLTKDGRGSEERISEERSKKRQRV